MAESYPDPLRTPSRVALAGDWHANADWAVKAVEHAAERRAEAILHLGDFGYTFQRPYLSLLHAALDEAGIPLLFVDGNHEDHPKLHRYPVMDNGLRQLTDHIWHLPRGFRWEWMGVRFLALGGACSVDRPWRIQGESWWAEEEITAQQAADCIDGGRADVLLSHDCPAGVVIPGIDDRSAPAPFPPLELMRSSEHRHLLRKVVDAVQPRWICHGHYHRQYWQDADLGYGRVRVIGLDCEGSLERNIQMMDLYDLFDTLRHCRDRVADA